MQPRTYMPDFRLAVPLAGATAGVFSALMLGFLASLRGRAPWAPLNATSHVLHGPEAGAVDALGWGHTALGTVIHLASAMFWAAVAVTLLRLLRRGSTGMIWAAGLGVAALALVVDYGLMPARLTPGWELERIAFDLNRMGLHMVPIF